ncbi:BamA/TamA family outer membrane protein [Archangium violaceum]|uniref:Omp85 family outer membrane protein n=1 Tax=Archangium violaceum TaxID=83451 RepID=UPI00193B6870|nr:BamA/TamA family outer membrane protein [Archangium violaceum]QRK05044.1 BamA/TamA family outer membrane protein [Archangium violaceum]
MLTTALLLTTLATAPTAPSSALPATGADSTASAPAEPPKKEKGFDGIVLPLVSYNSDLGFTYGGVAGAYLYAPGHAPYQHGIAIQAMFTSRGQQNHYLRYDGPQLIGPMRLELRLEYRRELRSPFYGAGNVSAQDFNGDENQERFNYTKRSPGAWVRLRGRPWGETHPFQSYVGYSWRYTGVDPFEASELQKLKPVGIEGGPTGQLMAGVLWDTRDNESDPVRGGVEELSLRVSGSATGSRYQYAGVTLSERRYWQLGPRFILAQRLTLDVLFGEVPFFEWVNTGGVSTSEGIGGMSSVRGIERNRFAGNIKAFSNTELRFRAFDFNLFGAPVIAGGVAFVDLGRVWHPQVTDGPWWKWHPGVGAGLRLSRRAAVVRFDWAMSTESGRSRLYLNFGHMF